MDVIDDMTREEQIRVREEAQRLLRSINLSRLTVHAGEARLDFYPAEIHGSARKRTTKKKAELLTDYDEIGLTSQLSTAKGGRPKVEIRATKDMTAFALLTADDGDSVYYMPRILSKTKPVDIKLGNTDTSINVQIAEPSEFLTQIQQAIANRSATTGANNGVHMVKAPGGRRNRGKPKQASFFVRILESIRRTLSPNIHVMIYVLLASIWFIYRDVQFFYRLRELGLEAIACKKCYAKNVYSFFQQSFFYLFTVISMLGYVYVAAHIVRTWSSGPYLRFAGFETFRLIYNFVTLIYNYYTLPHNTRTSLTPALYTAYLRSHFYDAIVVLLLLWNPKRNAGYKGLLRNAFGALLISILMTSSYFYCLSALHEKLIPGVDFQDWFDLERGFLDATEGFNGGLEEDVSRETLDHVDL
ncbi:hypothetical protein AAVH_16099 [Aphelenchoides avenae]|nr:hypothetical protein AAVH_16099 [Aphelenchus avenae]